MVVNIIKKGFKTCFGRTCRRVTKKPNQKTSINSGVTRKQRRRTYSPSPKIRYVPHTTLPLDKVLDADELDYFFKTYAKNGLSDPEYSKLGHFTKDSMGRTHIYPKDRKTIREMVKELILLIRLAENKVTGEIEYSDIDFFDPYNKKFPPIRTVILNRNSIIEFPSWVAYRDALAKKKGKTEISPKSMRVKNEEMELNHYKAE